MKINKKNKFQKTVFGAVIPMKNYSNYLGSKAMEMACKSKEYLECAIARLGGSFTPDQLTEEILKILIDQSLQKIVDNGRISYNKEKQTFKLVK